MAELVVALDTATAAEALQLVDRLEGLRWVKIGPVVFLDDGPNLVRRLKGKGLSVFLDLKWHDIPRTVAGAVEAAARLGVDMATVHALGGEAMLRAAVEASGGRVRVAAVSVLTSHDPASYWKVVGGGQGGDLLGEVKRLAELAAAAGCDAVVCSPAEVAMVRSVLGPGAGIVVPGIRPPGFESDDHRRSGDAKAAAAAGATHLVVGRPIVGATDPVAVYQRLCRELSGG